MTKTIEAQATNPNVIQPLAPRDKSKIGTYQRKQRGIPLPKGYTFQDLSTAQRQDIMSGMEDAWKKDYNAKKSTQRFQANVNLTRG